MLTDFHRGQCLCGVVQFEIDGNLAQPAACHCAMCRRHHGSLGVYTSAPARQVRIGGAELVRWYASSTGAERGFCARCGAKLFWRRKDGADLDIAIGALDGPTGLKLGKHIWVAFKGDYYDIADGLQQYAHSSADATPSAPAAPVSDLPHPQSHRGRCLCGAIDFTVVGRMRDISQCHCGQCRRWHGHAPAYTKAKWAAIELKGGDNIVWYQSSTEARRGSCRKCGSSLFWERHGGDSVSIAAGALDAPVGPRQRHHIFVADKGDYYDIPDLLPQFAASADVALPF
jgi:hypothetical protein